MLKINKWPNKSLLTAAHHILEVTEDTHKLIDQMLETMYGHNGVGLAANQVGRSERIFVVNDDRGLIIAINPVVEPITDDVEEKEESCLSLPGATVKIKRPVAIKLHCITREEKLETYNLSGEIARIVQHEMDHLEGKTILQTADFIERKRAKKQMVAYSRRKKSKK